MKRSFKAWTWLALAAMSFRAFVPAGYMLSSPAEFAAGSPLALCPVQSAELVKVLKPSRQHQHHHHGGSPESSPTSQSVTGCAFALASAAALPPSFSVAAAAPVSAEPPSAQPATRPHRPTRAFSARGPPIVV